MSIGWRPGRLLAQGGDIHVAEIGEHQRARDRRRGHHQEIDGLALGGEREPLPDAEPMLLVDHRKPEIGERDALLEERVGADRDVDFAVRQCGERGAARRRPVAPGHEPDAQADPLGERRHPLVMLAGEDFGRRHHRRLPSRFDHVRHRDQRDHRLARSDVALQEPDHALLGPEIGADILDRLLLRFGQRERQRGLEAATRARPRRGARGREWRACAPA